MIKITGQELIELSKKYRVMVYRIAFSYSGSRFDADDVTQEVFLKLFRSKREFRDCEHEKAFIIRMAINECKNLSKTAWSKRRTDIGENTSYTENFNEDEQTLKEYIMRLKPKYRAVIYLYYYEGYSVSEIAKILKVSETSITTQLSRARSQLKQFMTKEMQYE